MGRGTTARQLVAWLLVISVATPACGLVLGDDARQCSSDEDCPASVPPFACIDGLCLAGEANETTTSSAEDPCPAAAECVPAAPPGWYGPVLAIASETEPADCPGSAPMVIATGHAGLRADEAVCACDCDATDVGCDVTVFGALAECSQDFATALTEDTCAAVALGLLPPTAASVLPAMLDVCTPIGAEEVAALQWSSHVQTCAAEPVACDDGACMPIPDPLTGAATCIWDDGERDCPDADYTSRFVFHRGATDTRDCVPCSCGEPSRCRLGMYESTSCMDEPAFETLLDEPQCIPFADILPAPIGNVGLLVTAVVPAMGACEPIGGTPAGDAIPVDTFTVCCDP